jgi:hypothetical protein
MSKSSEQVEPLANSFLRVACDLLFTLNMEAVRSSETSVHFYRNTSCCILEDSTVASDCCENRIQHRCACVNT